MPCPPLIGFIILEFIDFFPWFSSLFLSSPEKNLELSFEWEISYCFKIAFKLWYFDLYLIKSSFNFVILVSNSSILSFLNFNFFPDT